MIVRMFTVGSIGIVLIGLSCSSPDEDPWGAITVAIEANRSSFSGGLAVEIATPAGVVYSHSAGFSTSDHVLVASSSKWVSATALLRLVDAGILDLDETMKGVLVDRNGDPWSGAMGEITLRRLLNLSSGITGDNSDSTVIGISLEEAVNRIYDDEHETASSPGSYFSYGSNHFRIAARYAEVKTGTTWAHLFDEQLRSPLEWSDESIFFDGENNPDPAGGLIATGIEYMRFMMLQLRKGLDGDKRLLSEFLIDEQRKDQFLPLTTIDVSPYGMVGITYHYGLGNWRECEKPEDTAACDRALRVSSTGTFGWAPWIDVHNNYAAVIMTRQPNLFDSIPSEGVKLILAGLIPRALARNPEVIRTVP